MENPIPIRTSPSVANRTDAFSDEWRCAFWYFPGQSDPEGYADEEGRCRRLAVRVAPDGTHWCDLDWHDA